MCRGMARVAGNAAADPFAMAAATAENVKAAEHKKACPGGQASFCPHNRGRAGIFMLVAEGIACGQSLLSGKVGKGGKIDFHPDKADATKQGTR